MNKEKFYQEAQKLGIGNTPFIPYEEDFDADIFIKNEAANASGSIKDRAALMMILDAEEKGLLHPGDTIVEATSGNMGISLAYVAAARGYKVVVAMPDSMTAERISLMQGLGAEVVLTPAKDGMQGSVDLVSHLSQKSGTVWLKQFQNPANCLAHYLTTADEIAAEIKVDVFVAGIGTSGTLTGTAKRLKEIFPQCEVVGVEPASSAVISRGEKGSHAIQGIGAGFVPPLFDPSVVDQIQLVTDDEALDMFTCLNKSQGYCCGLSGAANIVVAVRLAEKEEYAGKNIVTVFPDSDDRYISLLHKNQLGI